MSEYDDMEDQSEDGEIMKSPHRDSPLPLSKDTASFSLSEEDAEDTTDSLDIKPPQAMIHHHKSSRGNTGKRDKHLERDVPAGRREHVHGIKAELLSHRKGHHRSREHRDHREERLREKHNRHRERREAAAAAARDSKRAAAKEKVPEDLRERLLDKRRDGERRAKLERRREDEEKELRRERLLEAEREMVRQKEAYRRELDARRQRRHLEREKERTLREIARKRERSRSREHKQQVQQEGDEGDLDGEGPEGMQVVTVSDDSDNVESVVEPTSSGEEPAEEEQEEEQDSATSSEEEEEEEEEDEDEEEEEEEEDEEEEEQEQGDTEESGHASPPAVPPVPEQNGHVPEPPPEPELPPYLPAVQGCRSVEEFQCLNRIEEGTYGVVYRARDKRTDEVVALKRLKMEKEKEGFPITSLREINTLLKAQHPNIVTVREIVVGSNMDKIFIVMDYVEHDLKSLMETMKAKKQVFLPGEVKCLMQQLLRAVAHLHDNWILHRDLKTSNLLLSHKGILKVGDFGLAREYGSPLKAYTPVVVTLWYRSPELLLCSKEYSTPVDMWSVGCIFGEFLTMEALFPGKSEVDQLNRVFRDLGTPTEKIWPGYSKLPAVQKVSFTEYPVNKLRARFGSIGITECGMDLMNRFLTYDPVQRVTAEDALRHAYFTEPPLPIDPAMFPTWPAKSELGKTELAQRKAAASPRPPPGGAQYKELGDTDEDVAAAGFHMGLLEKGRSALGAGFSLKF